MAPVSSMFIFFLCVLAANCEETAPNPDDSGGNYSQDIQAVLDHLNSAPVRVYNYKEAILQSAQTKADITELTLDVSIDCLNEYPDLPCDKTLLTCTGFVRQVPGEGSKVLGDVECKQKIENEAETTSITPPKIEISTAEEPAPPAIEQSVALSNEAVSSESIGEHFVAIRKDSGPCLGCPFELNPEIAGVEELVDLGLRHIQSEQERKHIVIKVHRVQQQVVSGVKYILLVEIAPTVCPKDSSLEVESCPVDGSAQNVLCQITYIQKPWISKAKHITANNCTRSQEYVAPESSNPRVKYPSDIDNEIEVNGGREKPFRGDKPAFVEIPNFDSIAESGVIDEEMSPARLADLESQILFGEPSLTAHLPQELNSQILGGRVESYTEQPQIGDDFFSPSATFADENPATEDRPSNGDNTEFAVNFDASQPPQIEEFATASLPSDDRRDVVDEYMSFRIQYDEPRDEEVASTQPTLEESTNIPEGELQTPVTGEESPQTTQVSKNDAKDSSEESKVKIPPKTNKVSKDSSEESKSSESGLKTAPKSSSSSEDSSEEVSRPKRAIRQLEKITAEEKSLVKDLADFAASALDNIDDDNHKRVVLQILGAKKMTGDGVYYHLILRLGVSHCLENKPPGPDENCREKLFENYTKICKVQVHVNDDFNHPKMVKSQCQNIKRDKNDSNRTNYSRFKRSGGLVGGQTPLNKDNPQISKYLLEGLKHLDSQSSHETKYKPVEIIDATSQVVSGALYRIKARISPSDCSKSDQKDVTDCGLLKDAQPKICELKVWDQPWLPRREFTIKCQGEEKEYKFEVTSRDRRSLPKNHRNVIRSKRQIPGGISPQSKDNPAILQHLETSLLQLDSQSPHKNKYKVHEVLSASSQVVAGSLWRIKAKVVVSDCSKDDEKKANECGALQGAQPTVCNFKIWDQPWLPNGKQTNVTCEDDQKSYSFRSKRSTNYHKSHLLGKDDHDMHFSMFKDFMRTHNKIYSTKNEFKYRFKVFVKNMKIIRSLNKNERGTAKYGVTRFADLNRKEFSRWLGLRNDLRNENEMPFPQAKIPDIELPAEFDWRDKGAVAEVKNQQQCGSCWAFSVTGNIEGQYAIKHGNLLEFSEQELVDCDKKDEGCNGGLMDNAYREIERIGGLETEQDYPYDAEDEKCHFNSSLVSAQVTGAVNISHNETDMAKWLVKNGPISIAINANAMQFYVGGVSHPYKFLCSPDNLDHGVLIVGFGVHSYPMFHKTLPYWIVKNSWGTSWGEQGYYRVYRGDGTCGLNQTPSSAVVA